VLSSRLAQSLFGLRRYDEAEKLLRADLQAMRSVCGSEHPNTLSALTLLAFTLCHREQADEGIMLLREVLGTEQRLHGEDHTNTRRALENLRGALSRWQATTVSPDPSPHHLVSSWQKASDCAPVGAGIPKVRIPLLWSQCHAMAPFKFGRFHPRHTSS
jgi:hypothetical protein